jgi:hypothetical protein
MGKSIKNTRRSFDDDYDEPVIPQKNDWKKQAELREKTRLEKYEIDDDPRK